MLWRTSTKPDRSKVLNMTEKTFSIALVRVQPRISERARTVHVVLHFASPLPRAFLIPMS